LIVRLFERLIIVEGAWEVCLQEFCFICDNPVNPENLCSISSPKATGLAKNCKFRLAGGL